MAITNDLNGGAFRKKKVNFTMVSNLVVRDSTFPTKCLGLYVRIQSYITLENFILYKNTLRKLCPEGEKAFDSMWKGLKQSGYLMQYRLKNSDGTFRYEYDLLEIPNSDESLATLESVHTPKKEYMDNVPCGKGGIYNKTDLINTDLSNTKDIKEEIKPITKKLNINKVINNYTINAELKTTIIDFLDMRRKQKDGITDTAITKMLTKLSKIGKTDAEKIEILDNSTMCSYKGIFPLNAKQQVTPTKKYQAFGNPMGD